ncbi:MAG: FapA family protein [Burkholderiales bacterium]|nr:FapA family protein [Burkholderiales bacterium]
MQNDPPEKFNESEFGSSSFIVKSRDGVFVELSRLESSSQFRIFVERVFSSGYHFTGLDYKLFLELLSAYAPEKLAIAVASLKLKGKATTVRFASDILPFIPERAALYRTARIVSGKAEYLFEPVMIERTIEEPVFAETEGGGFEVEGKEKRVVSEKTQISFDEFVAAMWLKGIRYGIDSDAVREFIGSGKSGRVVFARPLSPQNGQDSSLKEATDRLYRDNAPRELPNGKCDLRQFKNRFPQIRRGERLLKKSPRVLGIPGIDLSGEEIEPPLPNDFDLSALSGPGTQIDRTAEGEFIVASMDGFLNIDTQTNVIAVTEKIVNYTGVNMRTTGDISLEGEHFEEHGDIQEKRVVEGKSITVLGDVFGAVVSAGGKIHFKKNLVGGSATNHDGDITIDGLASNAIMHAKYGTICLKRAENSMIIGKNLIIESAINCTILGETIRIEISEGCAIAGKEVRITASGPRKENQTLVSMLLPDLSGFDVRIAEIGIRMGEIDSDIEVRRKKTHPITEQPEVRNYLIIAGKLQRKEITLSDEQKSNWQKLGARVAPALKALSAINAEIKTLQAEKESLEEEVAALEAEKEASGKGISCSIGTASKETFVRKREVPMGAPPLFDLPAKDLRIRLRDPGLPEDRLHVDGDRDFSWQHVP